jgi:hypothetical protein
MVAELDAGKAGSAVSQKAASDLGTRETQPSTTGKAGSAVSQKPVALQRAQSLRAAGNKARLIQKVVKNDGTTSRIEASLVSVHLPPAAVPGDPGAVAESTFWPEPAARDAFDFKVRSSMMPRPFGICSAYDVPWAEDQCVQDRHDATSNAFYVGDHVEMGYSTGYLGNWNVAAGAEKQNVRYFVAQNAKQVSAAIKEFRAKAKNKPMIIVKNTGHDYLGRGMLSGADVGNDVLVVWTHRLQGKVYHGDVGKVRHTSDCLRWHLYRICRRFRSLSRSLCLYTYGCSCIYLHQNAPYTGWAAHVVDLSMFQFALPTYPPPTSAVPYIVKARIRHSCAGRQRAVRTLSEAQGVRQIV